jgi:hypothetical protein
MARGQASPGPYGVRVPHGSAIRSIRDIGSSFRVGAGLWSRARDRLTGETGFTGLRR